MPNQNLKRYSEKKVSAILGDSVSFASASQCVRVRVRVQVEENIPELSLQT